MAEDVNFPVGQERNAGAFTGKSRQTEDQKEEKLENTARAREKLRREPVSNSPGLSTRVDISIEARQKGGSQSKNPTEDREDIAEAERRELQANRREVSTDAQSDFRNPRSQGPAGINELSRTSEGSVQDPEERSSEELRAENDQSDPDRDNEIENGTRVDSVRSATAQANEDVDLVEEEDPSRPLKGAPSIRDVGEEGLGPQGRERLEENLKSDAPSAEERVKASLENSDIGEIDSKVQERLQEERVEEARKAVREEPALETPRQTIEPIETPEEPIKEGLDTNPLRGPGPSELKRPSGEAVETERGQNVSNLI